VKNLGVFFDSVLNMDHQIRNITKSCYHQLRNIGHIRPSISESACKTLVCSLVTFRLDYGNALLYGICTSSLTKLQRIQNTAARIITRTKKHDHITPVLVNLHWLPVEHRIQYRLLLQTFKAVNGTSPLYIQELVQVYTPSRPTPCSLFSRARGLNDTATGDSTWLVQHCGTVFLKKKFYSF
jgi:hypothetical protein